jgi:hypothetical protein
MWPIYFWSSFSRVAGKVEVIMTSAKKENIQRDPEIELQDTERRNGCRRE